MEDLDFDDEPLEGQIDDDDVWLDVGKEINEASRKERLDEAHPVKMMLLKVSSGVF